MGWKDVLKQPLVRKFHKEYERCLEERKDSFEAFIRRGEAEIKASQAGLSESAWDEIDRIKGDLLLLQIDTGKILEGAEDVFARFFYENPDAVLAYSDEVWNKNGEAMPWFKPDWSPDTFLDRFYFGGLVVVRKSVFEQEVKLDEKTATQTDWWRVFEWFLKVKGGFNNRKDTPNRVLHVPYILFERDEKPEFSCETNDDKITDVTAGVSVIIPSKDHPELVEKCVSSLRDTVKELSLEIIVVDNGSDEENRRELEKLSKSLQFMYLYVPMPFHFAKMCNLGVEHATKEQVLFLNDDIECIHEGWLEEMVRIAARPHVGAVGSKLLYPDGKRIQHAGITNLPIGPVHKLQFLNDEEIYYDDYNRGVRNVIAVTGACLLMRRELFLECGGMSEELAVAFNDVELCFKLYEMGYYQVVFQDKPLIHHESLSRGDDESVEKWQRLMKERATVYRLHPNMEGIDPFYNVHLNRKGLDTRILPEYMQGKQEQENVTCVFESTELLKEARQDQCLLLRTEICREAVTDSGAAGASMMSEASVIGRIELYGYGVVLGSDNALFHKELLLREVCQNEGEEAKVYRIPFKGQYRADLEANMPDQTNVALSGFWVTFEKDLLPKGCYEVGMYAADRTTRTKLYCFSSRRVEK